jgi:TolA-binding protein
VFLNCIRALILLLIPLLMACESERAETALLLDQANREWVDGQTQKSVSLYKNLLERFPKEPESEEALFRLGEIYHFSLGNPKQAILYFQEVLLLNRQGKFSYEAQKYIADIVEFKIRDFDQAIIEYQTLIDRYGEKNENEDHHFRIASIYYKLQNYDQALAELEDHLEYYPDSKWGESSDLKAVEILYTLGRCQDAQPHYDRFVKKYPTSKHRLEMEFVHASCLEEQGQLTEAREKFKSLENKYPFPAMLEMKLTGLDNRIKNGPKNKRVRRKR